MNLIDKFDYHLSKWSIPYFFNFILVLHFLGYISIIFSDIDVTRLILTKNLLFNGEIWRCITFLLIPGSKDFLYLFMFYVFYMIGNSMEQHWGSSKFNGFVLITYLLTIFSSIIAPSDTIIPNWYIFSSVFLAFSTIFSDVQFYLFFVIPVKVKWLGWIKFVYMLLMLSVPSERWAILSAFFTYFLFFNNEIINMFKRYRRKYNFKNSISNDE